MDCRDVVIVLVDIIEEGGSVGIGSLDEMMRHKEYQEITGMKILL